GFRYTWGNRRIRAMITTIAVASFFGAPVTALLPVFAADVYGRGAGGFGSLVAAMGAGSVLGALALGRTGSKVSPGLVATSLLGLAVSLAAFAAIPSYGAGLALRGAARAAHLLTVCVTTSAIP